MPSKIEPFSPDVLPHYEGQYRVFQKPDDLLPLATPVFGHYTTDGGWTGGTPPLGWIGVSHQLKRVELDRLHDELVQWQPNAAGPANYARKAVKLFRKTAQRRAETGAKKDAQRASLFFQVATTLSSIARRANSWPDDFPTAVDIQAQQEGAQLLGPKAIGAVDRAVKSLLEGNGNDLFSGYVNRVTKQK
ncbi:hypothetical protein [Achromobacter anxifer]|uniref:hypothetical protein n=1 Tax=Achromobacter anxifer TaxID=1287737 RepID=UPI0023F720B3|nr:hypothetical protein [Achromobacter anxifer]MDF8364721.1 hypothetical protein [Achromobacter anxifer]